MKFRPIYLFIGCAAIAAGVLWVNVFQLLHDGILAYIGGIPAGIANVGLVAYSANALPRVQSVRARRAGWFILGLLAVVEPIVLGFANFPNIIHRPISMTGANVVAGGSSLTITLALILGALVDRSLVPADKPSKTPKVDSKEGGKGAGKAGKTRKASPQVARKPVTDGELMAYLASNPGESHKQVAAHFGVSRQAIGQRVKKLYEVKSEVR